MYAPHETYEVSMVSLCGAGVDSCFWVVDIVGVAILLRWTARGIRGLMGGYKYIELSNKLRWHYLAGATGGGIEAFSDDWAPPDAGARGAVRGAGALVEALLVVGGLEGATRMLRPSKTLPLHAATTFCTSSSLPNWMYAKHLLLPCKS